MDAPAAGPAQPPNPMQLYPSPMLFNVAYGNQRHIKSSRILQTGRAFDTGLDQNLLAFAGRVLAFKHSLLLFRTLGNYRGRCLGL